MLSIACAIRPARASRSARAARRSPTPTANANGHAVERVGVGRASPSRWMSAEQRAEPRIARRRPQRAQRTRAAPARGTGSPRRSPARRAIGEQREERVERAGRLQPRVQLPERLQVARRGGGQTEYCSSSRPRLASPQRAAGRAAAEARGERARQARAGEPAASGPSNRTEREQRRVAASASLGEAQARARSPRPRADGSDGAHRACTPSSHERRRQPAGSGRCVARLGPVVPMGAALSRASAGGGEAAVSPPVRKMEVWTPWNA